MRSKSSRFKTRLRSALAESLCKNMADMPFTIASIAFLHAAMFALSSVDSAANSPTSFSRCRRGIRDRLLRRLAVLLVLREVRLQLRLRRHRLLDGRLDLRDLLRQLLDAAFENAGVRLAVAHILLVHLLILLAIDLNLLGHGLEKIHDAPNRVLRRRFLFSDCSCLYSCKTDEKQKGAHSPCVRDVCGTQAAAGEAAVIARVGAGLG